MKNRFAIVLGLMLAACAPPASDRAPDEPAVLVGPPPAPMAYALFDVASDIAGPIRTGTPVTIETVVRARTTVDDAVLILAMPEVAAALATGWGAGYRPFDVGVRPPAIDSVVARVAPGAPLRRTSTVRFEAPGYYHVIATASSPEDTRYEENGVPLVDPQHYSYYVWVDEETGYVTRDFDPTRLPLASDGSAGPILRTSRAAGLAVQLDSARAAPRTHGVLYGTVTDADGAPVAGVRVEARAYMEGCPGRGAAEETTRTDTAGRYRLVLRGWPRAPFDACVAVHADLDGAHGTSQVALRMRQVAESSDSVRVDLRMTSSADD